MYIGYTTMISCHLRAVTTIIAIIIDSSLDLLACCEKHSKS